jgi:hypothetical protein
VDEGPAKSDEDLTYPTGGVFKNLGIGLDCYPGNTKSQVVGSDADCRETKDEVDPERLWRGARRNESVVCLSKASSTSTVDERRKSEFMISRSRCQT